MMAATFFVFRMTKPGLWLTQQAVSIVSVVRTQRFAWEQVPDSWVSAVTTRRAS